MLINVHSEDINPFVMEEINNKLLDSDDEVTIEQVNHILEKISSNGYHNLTETEKNILKKYTSNE